MLDDVVCYCIMTYHIIVVYVTLCMIIDIIIFPRSSLRALLLADFNVEITIRNHLGMTLYLLLIDVSTCCRSGHCCTSRRIGAETMNVIGASDSVRKVNPCD